MQELMTRREAAKYLGISTQTLATWACRRSDGPPYVKFGYAVRYRRTDLDAYIAAHLVRCTSDVQN